MTPPTATRSPTAAAGDHPASNMGFSRTPLVLNAAAATAAATTPADWRATTA
ncbi:MAG TPA: hypothetical protein VGM94_04815 [Galbitalea sp.]